MLRREEREHALDAVSRPARPAPSVRATRARAEEPDPYPALLRARSRSHQALAPVAAARREVPGVHRAGRRSPAHPAHARGGGRPGRHRHRACRRAERRAHRGDRARARLRSRPGRARVGGGVHAVRARRLRPRGVRRRRHARAAQPLRRDARRRAQPLVAAAGTVHARGRGGRVGRSDRVREPRLHRRGASRHPRPRRAARRDRRRRRPQPVAPDRRVRRGGARRDRPHRSRRDDRAGRRRAARSSVRSTSTASTCGRPRVSRPRRSSGLLRGLVDFFVDAPTRMPVDATDMHAGLVPGIGRDGRGRGALRERHDRSVRARARCRVARAGAPNTCRAACEPSERRSAAAP